VWRRLGGPVGWVRSVQVQAGKISQTPTGAGQGGFKFCRCRQKINVRWILLASK